MDRDARDNDSDAMAIGDDGHGTMVAGVIAAEHNNGIGGAGIAPDATIVGYRMGFGSDGDTSQEIDLLQRQVNVDISNNSWGYGGFFYDNFDTNTFRKQGEAIENAVENGREGLGTVFVFAAGNSGDEGDDANYHSFQNSRFTIAVGAVDSSGDVTSFSTTGAAMLVSAPGQGVYTTDRPGSDGSSSGDHVTVNGTSFAAPAVSGVIALMLEANAELGYRDVQEILAYSAKNTDTTHSDWQTNGATNWNGGGLTVNHDYGFGMVDAHAAVRLAETWNSMHTHDNELSTSVSSGSINLSIPDNGSVSDELTLTNNLKIDHVEIDIDLDHTYIGDLIITLESSSGTKSVLVDRPGLSAENQVGVNQADINFTLSSVQFWGESANGTWKLTVTDANGQDTGALKSWSITAYGDQITNDDTYIYTDEFTLVGDPDGSRSIVKDSSGVDTLNFAAVTKNIELDLSAGSFNMIGNRFLQIDSDTIIENAYTGDGNDRIIGNAEDNTIIGGRGDDNISGEDGLDRLIGGHGNDTLMGGNGADIFVYESVKDGLDEIIDFQTGSNGDAIELSEFFPKSHDLQGKAFEEGAIKAAQYGSDTYLSIATSSDLSADFYTFAVLKDTQSSSLTEDNFIY